MAKFNLFIDTNIIIDLLADRKPFSNSAYLLFKNAKSENWDLSTSSNSIITTFYILEKQIGAKKAKSAIETILKRIEIQDINKQELKIALKSKTEDLEDASQIEGANKISNINFIITRDKKGFKHSPIEVMNPDELLLLKLKK